jgi:hypothetical protein
MRSALAAPVKFLSSGADGNYISFEVDPDLQNQDGPQPSNNKLDVNVAQQDPAGVGSRWGTLPEPPDDPPFRPQNTGLAKPLSPSRGGDQTPVPRL